MVSSQCEKVVTPFGVIVHAPIERGIRVSETDKCFRDIDDVIKGMQGSLLDAYGALESLGAHLLKHGQNDPKVARLIPSISSGLISIGNSLVSLGKITGSMREGGHPLTASHMGTSVKSDT